MRTPETPDRTRWMAQHVEARRRRDAAALGSDEYRAASEEVARIEIEIATAEELSGTATQAATNEPRT